MSDNSSSNSSEKLYIPYFVPVYYEIIVYSCLAIIGVVGNVVTCFVIVTNKSMHTATNCYLFNLAVSDLMILFWDFPVYTPLITSVELCCQLRVLMAITAVHVTILTLSVFSVERYLAICHPFLTTKHKLSSVSRALRSIPAIWLIGFVCALPISLEFGLIHNVVDSTLAACTFVDETALYFAGLASIIFFLTPMLLICTMYILIGLKIKESAGSIRRNHHRTNRSKQRAPKMLMVVVIAFFICWAPVYIERVLFTVSAINLLEDGLVKTITHNILINVSQVLYYSSSIINPILYNIMSKKFRKAFKTTISSCCGIKFCSASHTTSSTNNSKTSQQVKCTSLLKTTAERNM